MNKQYINEYIYENCIKYFHETQKGNILPKSHVNRAVVKKCFLLKQPYFAFWGVPLPVVCWFVCM